MKDSNPCQISLMCKIHIHLTNHLMMRRTWCRRRRVLIVGHAYLVWSLHEKMAVKISTTTQVMIWTTSLTLTTSGAGLLHGTNVMGLSWAFVFSIISSMSLNSRYVHLACTPHVSPLMLSVKFARRPIIIIVILSRGPSSWFMYSFWLATIYLQVIFVTNFEKLVLLNRFQYVLLSCIFLHTLFWIQRSYLLPHISILLHNVKNYCKLNDQINIIIKNHFLLPYILNTKKLTAHSSSTIYSRYIIYICIWVITFW